MNAFFYPRLALSGMRRDRRIYAPYLAACVFMTAVVYDLAFLADSPALYAVGSGVNGMGTSAIRLVMTLGKWVMAVFALLFFFYTNAFLIRRRKKELGLMSVLGMDRGALASLVYRMKRSGAGLAVICILSTMILVMLGSTAGLYFGAEDVVRTLSAEMSREIAAEARAEFYATYGSLFFLALVLSTVFLLASVLMLYYKQLSEGYEDAARFAVMQRVGMTKRDIRTSVNAQLRMVFLLPLLAAFVHLAFAQPMIWRILRLFGLQNLPLVLGVTACACAVFTVLYCAACRLTSNAYCRIVGEGV